MKIFITGCRGFIRFSFANFLAKSNKKITGVDKFTDVSIGLKNTIKWFINSKDTIKF